MSVPTRIRRLLDGGQMQEMAASDDHVAGLWGKAVASARDARNPANSLDDRYVLGYQALLQAGTAVLAAAGFRTKGAQGHHANTFYAVAALGIEGLEDADVRLEAIRKQRAVSAYDPGSPTQEQLGRLIRLLHDILPAARRWLAAARPEAPLVPIEDPAPRASPARCVSPRSARAKPSGAENRNAFPRNVLFPLAPVSSPSGWRDISAREDSGEAAMASASGGTPPNGPSTTGNPSGGGRGNNPPKR